MLSGFRLFLVWIMISKNNRIKRGYHFTCIWSITLCYSWSAVVLLGLPHTRSVYSPFIAISDSILAIDGTLDRSKAYICFVYWSRHIYFTSWRAEIAIISRPCQLFFVKCRRATCIIISGYSLALTVRLESALDLVKKMQRVKERHWSNHSTKDHPEEIPKNLDGRFASIHISSNLLAKTLVTNWR